MAKRYRPSPSTPKVCDKCGNTDMPYGLCTPRMEKERERLAPRRAEMDAQNAQRAAETLARYRAKTKLPS